MSKFQIILLVVFGFFILAAVFLFAVYRGKNSQSATVVIWGSLPAYEFNTFLNNRKLQNDKLSIRYVEKPEAKLESEFTEALARGEGPDLILLRQDAFYKNKAKLVAIPYSSVSQRNFVETFAEAAEIYLGPEGVYALPFTIDPLVLYYNRDLLSAAGLAQPVSFWDEIYALTGNLTKRDAAGNLTQSTVALGEVRNIANAKDIFALLLLQAGTPITVFQNNSLRPALSASFSLPVRPADAATEFYTQFANPTKSFYSWNRSLPEAQTRFTSGSLVYYLGFASELKALRNKNPTLNFAVAPVPQSRVSGKTVTTARLFALSLSRGSKNSSAALSAAFQLVSKEAAKVYSELTLWPPARRDLLAARPSDAVLSVFYSGALQSRSWIDPDAQGSAKVFTELIEAVTSGRAKVSESVLRANAELETLIND